tara:strand:+ start:114 stop:302 length:189 start_codon:yes stop_codon:yes gene_type:complete
MPRNPMTVPISLILKKEREERYQEQRSERCLRLSPTAHRPMKKRGISNSNNRGVVDVDFTLK